MGIIPKMIGAQVKHTNSTICSLEFFQTGPVHHRYIIAALVRGQGAQLKSAPDDAGRSRHGELRRGLVRQGKGVDRADRQRVRRPYAAWSGRNRPPSQARSCPCRVIQLIYRFGANGAKGPARNPHGRRQGPGTYGHAGSVMPADGAVALVRAGAERSRSYRLPFQASRHLPRTHLAGRSLSFSPPAFGELTMDMRPEPFEMNVPPADIADL